MIDLATYDAGIVTAYGAAVRGGYTGTYEQFCTQQANYATSAAAVEQAKEDVQELIESIPEDYSQLSEDVSDLDDRVTALEEGGSGSGLTEDIKQALLQITEKVVYTDEHGQDYYDALYNAFYPPANLVSISAVYTQSGTVYDTDSLDSLKTDLVVTALYDDQTTETVTTYTLSGTLTEGTSTITVSYGGKTTTFNVTVSHIDATIVYRLPSTTVFDGSTTVVNTGVAPFTSDSDFTFTLTYKAPVTQNSYCGIWSSGDGNKIYVLRPLNPDTAPGAWTTYVGGKTGTYIGGNFTTASENDTVRYVLRHKTGSKFEVFASVNGSTVVNGTMVGDVAMPTSGVELRLGKSYSNSTYFTGTVYDFVVYERALTDDEITAYLAE